MDLQECEMIMVSIVEQAKSEGKYPFAQVITIAPSRQKALELAILELEPYKSSQNDYLRWEKNLGAILFSPIPTTIFLYTQEAARIK